MRLSTQLSDLHALVRLAPVCAALVAVSGCGIAPGPTYDPYTLYLTTPSPVEVRKELLGRYACAAETPLVCQCTSRLGDCQCRC